MEGEYPGGEMSGGTCSGRICPGGNVRIPWRCICAALSATLVILACWFKNSCYSSRTSSLFAWKSTKKFSCRRHTARCFVSLNISLSHSRSLEVTSLSRAFVLCLVPFLRSSASNNDVTLKSWLGSFKVIANGTTRQTVHEFLFDFRCNYGHDILYRYQDKVDILVPKRQLFIPPSI